MKFIKVKDSTDSRNFYKVLDYPEWYKPKIKFVTKYWKKSER